MLAVRRYRESPVADSSTCPRHDEVARRRSTQCRSRRHVGNWCHSVRDVLWSVFKPYLDVAGSSNHSFNISDASQKNKRVFTSCSRRPISLVGWTSRIGRRLIFCPTTALSIKFSPFYRWYSPPDCVGYAYLVYNRDHCCYCWAWRCFAVTVLCSLVLSTDAHRPPLHNYSAAYLQEYSNSRILTPPR